MVQEGFEVLGCALLRSHPGEGSESLKTNRFHCSSVEATLQKLCLVFFMLVSERLGFYLLLPFPKGDNSAVGC